jgi:uncharacterized protein YigE (DUF2233 family)
MAAIRCSLLLAALLLFGCGKAPPPPPEVDPWCEIRVFEGSRFTACSYDSAKHRLELILDDEQGPLRNFANLERHLGERKERLLFAMNAGMYDERGMPIGLYVEDGEERAPLNLRDGPGNFHLKPNGVFAVDRKGRLSITRSENFKERVPDPLWATQSGPLLLSIGELHPKIDTDGRSVYVRNGVCLSGPGKAWFLISDENVSFGRFARFMHDELGCEDGLYFDGAVSSLWDLRGNRQGIYPELGPFVAVFKKDEKGSVPRP